jgi:protein-tyrosine phosphatase
VIDTHCHLLPGLDDGPRSELEAVRMARQLVRFGVKQVVCTPHYSRRYPTSMVAAAGRRIELIRALSALGIELETHLGAEVHPELVLTAPDDELLGRALPGGFLLVELIASTPARFVSAALERLGVLELLPVFAHPERCHAVQRRPELLDEPRAAGALVQIVAPSLLMGRDRSVTNAAWNLLDAGRADLLATDAHTAHGTRTQLRPLGDLVARRYGHEAVEQLTLTNARKLFGRRAPSAALDQ